MGDQDKPNREDAIRWLDLVSQPSDVDPASSEAMSDEEVQAELKAMNLDPDPVVAWAEQAVKKSKRGARIYYLTVGLSAAAVLVLGLYLVLLLVSRATLPETYTMASLEIHQPYLENRARSDNPNASGDFELGVQALLSAHHSFGGLFPGHDQTIAQEASVLLTRAFENTPDADKLNRAEIAFLLAKAALMQGDMEEARHRVDYIQNLGVDWRGEYYGEDVETLLQTLPEVP